MTSKVASIGKLFKTEDCGTRTDFISFAILF